MDIIKPRLQWIPNGKPDWHAGWMNGLARSLELILREMGHDTDYDTLMGDLGQAFIVQGEENSINLFNGAVDVGWWPNEPLGYIRLGFLEQALGRKLLDSILYLNDTGLEPAEYYQERIRPLIIASLVRGQPCIVRFSCTEYIITGYDEDKHQLVGMCPNTPEKEVRLDRITEDMPPFAFVSVGDPIPKMDREKADLESLKFAIALHRDLVLEMNHEYSGTYSLRHGNHYRKYWRTGIKTLHAWISCLEDHDHMGEHYWHNNVKYTLEWNRKSAVRYLTAMKNRHDEIFASCLDNAISKYRTVIELICEADTGEEAMLSVSGREKLISVIRKIIMKEQEAVCDLEKAINR